MCFKKFLMCIVFFICLDRSYGIRCFVCSYVDPGSDKSCVINAEEQKSTVCSRKYCTIQRQESLNPAGKILSFIRDCQDKPLYLNDVQTDAEYKVYYRSCTSDLCNNGDGVEIVSSADPNFGAGENIIVEGKSGAKPNYIHPNQFWIIILVHLIDVFFRQIAI